jgi:hypothetical protein
LYSTLIRIPTRLRAGHIMMGCVPRSKILRHSRSMGEWKPPIDLRCQVYTLHYLSSPFNCSGVLSWSHNLSRQQKDTNSWSGFRPAQALGMPRRACPWGSTHIFPPNSPPSFEYCLQLTQIFDCKKFFLGCFQVFKCPAYWQAGERHEA